jgi:hypothetical protein
VRVESVQWLFVATREGHVLATPVSRYSTKFARLDSKTGGDPYQDQWSQQKTTGPDRLVVAPRGGRHVDVLLALARCLPEPFGILYVLLLSRTGAHLPGRYQSSVPTTRDETEAFVRRFAGYFEGDGRHHLWLMSLPGRGTLVYDNHDLVYAYGPLEGFKSVLTALGFSEGAVAIPAQHQHSYNQQYDSSEDDVMGYWDWKHFPLQPDDDP